MKLPAIRFRLLLLLAALAAVFVGALAGGVAAAVLAFALALALGTLFERAVARLRPGAPAAPGGLRIHELDALAGAVARTLGEAQQRVTASTRERDEIALLIDAVGEGIVQLGGRGELLRANRAARELLRLPQQPVSQPVSVLIRHPELRHALERGARGAAADPFEIALDERRLLVAVKPLPAALTSAGTRGGPAAGGAVAVLVDLTELRRLEDIRRDFVANASHELKTPLTSIRGYTETLLRDEVPPEIRQHFLATIHRNAERLQHIVDHLLDLSRLESGTWAPQLRAVEPGALAAEAWAAFAERAAEQQVIFTVETAAEADVEADPVALRQVFANLFDNALRYVDQGGTIRVRVHAASSAAEMLAIDVEDDGCGIPQAALPRIFERFFRVDPARSRAEGGTGLGLAIVKHLVESMGGEVAARSELGKGTTVTILLRSRSRTASLER